MERPTLLRPADHPSEDLAAFQWPCDLRMKATTLSPDGNRVVMEARNTADPRGTTVVAHRACLLGARCTRTATTGPASRCSARKGEPVESES